MLLDTLLHYDSWANREMIASLASGSTPRANSLMAHIIAAEVLWIARIRGEGSPLSVWPDLTNEECARLASQLPERWRSVLENYPGETGTTPIEYANSKGEPFTSTVEQIILHVVTHSNYHRGQIASDLRAAGINPVYTDFIHASRLGYIE